MTTGLQHALEALYGLERRRDKHDLEGITALLAALGDPQRRFRSVHVAGTNGKGSVCALIERVLREAGVRTGLFTSPHLVDFRERIRVRGRWADEAWLERRLEHIASLPGGRDLTFFEVCTGLAFDYFAAQNVDIAVVEVGLGGRLDCTNVLAPLVSVITSVGLDHTEILGDTIELIAAEKAGIARAGVPLVVGRLDDRARAVVERVAAACGAPITGAAPRIEVGAGFQSENAAVATEALAVLSRAGVAIPERALQDGLRAARWPGRLERCPTLPRLWWDGAHNAQGMAALVRAWNAAERPAPREVVLALSSDKDAAAIVAALAPFARDSGLVATRAHHDRAMPPEQIAALATAAGMRARVAPDVAAACRSALAGAEDGTVLLTGSLFAVGEAMTAFGGAPGELL